jgi:hypothetical protein
VTLRARAPSEDSNMPRPISRRFALAIAIARGEEAFKAGKPESAVPAGFSAIEKAFWREGYLTARDAAAAANDRQAKGHE